MLIRRRLPPVFVLLILLIMFNGCSPSHASTPTKNAPATAATASPTATVEAATPVAPATTVAPAPTSTPPATLQPNPTMNMTTACRLIDSSDLAHLFPPHNEIVRETPKTAAVSHPPFSSSPAPGTEFTCLFYDFHQPGVITGWTLEVTYHVDLPDPAAVQAWSQAWDAAKASAAQPVSGLGDDAFTVGPVLYLKKGTTYLTFESVDTHLDEKTPAGVQQLLAYEKQLAAAALGRIK